MQGKTFRSWRRPNFPGKAASPIISILTMIGLFWLSGTWARAGSDIPSDETNDFFEKRIRPLLSAKCWECHGEDDPESNLKLTSRDAVLKGGTRGPAAIPGQPDKSLLIRAVRHQGKLKMPQDSKLSDSEISALSRWVELKLPWPESKNLTPNGTKSVTEADRQHWSFQELRRVKPPKPDHSDWPLTDIDRFIVAKWNEVGLQPAPPTDRRVLLRRAYHDLTGLPPKLADIQAFIDDPAPTEKALARVIDQLLASPRYGERWGRHWLDVARYADTKDGVLMYGDDRIRPFAYTYRDYVIRAFNQDLPYDQFIKDQIAADRAQPPVEPWRLAAMGFLTLGRMYDNNIHDIIDDQIDVVTRGFLGLTVACARCHDHKFDPIPTADYYSLYGVFAASETPLEPPLVETPAKGSKAEEFEKQAVAKRAELRKFLDEQYEQQSKTAKERVTDYLVHVATTKPDPLETAIFFLSLDPETLRPQIIARWRRVLEQKAQANDPVFGPWHDLSLIPNETDFAKASQTLLESWKTKARGTEPGQINSLVFNVLSQAKLTNRTDMAKAYGALLKRVYEESRTPSQSSSAKPNNPELVQILDLIASQDSPTWFPKSQTRKYMSRQQTDAYGGKIQEIDRMAVKSPDAPGRAMTLQDAESASEPRILIRGNPSRPGERVPRRFLAIASPKDRERQPFGPGSGRGDLANAIASPDNPLTARVIVNRVWAWHFGEPLVGTLSDFGKRAEAPIHRDLLDHLAAYLIDHNWSLKALHRYILSSRIYRIGSMTDANDKGWRIDPENRLIWRFPRQRLDFESMRDSLLAVSGKLEHRSGGRPSDIATNINNNCRTIYGLIDRQSLPGFFRAFDFPAPDQSIERRPRTMTPQQTLFALNSPFLVQQTQALIQRPEVKSLSEPKSRIEMLYRLVYGRDPDRDEIEACLAFVNAKMESASRLGLWEQLAQVLLSSNEFMYID